MLLSEYFFLLTLIL